MHEESVIDGARLPDIIETLLVYIWSQGDIM